MTDFYGVNATLRDSDVPSQKEGVGESRGRIRLAYDTKTFTTAFNTTDKLYMSLIPKHARIVDVWVKSENFDGGSTGQLNIGWEASSELDSSASAVEAADADGFWAALDVQGGDDVFKLSDSTASPGSLFKKFSAEVRTVIVPSTSCDATDGVLSMGIYYVVD